MITWKDTILLGFQHLELCPLYCFLCFQSTLLHVFPFSYECFLLCRHEFPISYIAHVHSLIIIWKNLEFDLSQQSMHTLTTNKSCLSTFTRFSKNTWILFSLLPCDQGDNMSRGHKQRNGFRNPKFLQSDFGYFNLYQWLMHTVHWSFVIFHLDCQLALVHKNQRKIKETFKS